MKTRRRFTAEFKAKVALEAIRGERTIYIIRTDSVSPQLMNWLITFFMPT